MGLRPLKGVSTRGACANFQSFRRDGYWVGGCLKQAKNLILAYIKPIKKFLTVPRVIKIKSTWTGNEKTYTTIYIKTGENTSWNMHKMANNGENMMSS